MTLLRCALALAAHRLMRNWRQWWMRFLHDFREAYGYIRDPHGWEHTRRVAGAARFCPRPGMFLNGGSVIVHPALVPKLRRDLSGMTTRPEDRGALFADTPGRIAGMDIYVSGHAVEQPPVDGWPDVQVPQRPRLAP